MIYIFIAALSLLLLLIIINYLRKLHWDIIHRNLLDLVDEIGGKVIRQGMLGRPIYHGQYNNLDITVNFSTERIKSGRKNLIDISIGTPLKQSFTISSFDWLNEREESAIEEFEEFNMDGTIRYGIRKSSDTTDINEKLQTFLKELDPFLFLFVGTNGILFEKEGGNLAISTRHPELKNQLMSISALIGVLE